MINDSGSSGSWRTSTYSGSHSNCVQIGRADTRHVVVRDSKDPGGPVLRFGREEWVAFVRRQRTPR